MRTSFLMALVVAGLSVNAFADNHGAKKAKAPGKTIEHVEKTTQTVTETSKTVALSAKEAEAACKKEGKAGADLASCIKTKTATH